MSINSPSPGLVIAAGAIWPPICTAAVVLRFLASRRQAKRAFVDDWLTIPALLLLWGQGLGLIIGVAKHSLGYPDPDPPPGVDPDTFSSPESVLSRKLFYSILLMQIPGLTCIKLSFIFFYRRVLASQTLGRNFDRFLLCVAAVLIAWAIAFFFAELFICGTTFEDVWRSKSTIEESAVCVQLTPFDEAFTASDFMLDILVLVIPIFPLAHLKLSIWRKLGLFGVFSLGVFAIAASITRFVVFTNEENLTFTVCLYWTCLESAIALLTSCLPSIFGLFNNMRKRAKETKASGYSSTWWSSRRGSETLKGRFRLGSNAPEIQDEPGSQGILVTNTFETTTEPVPLVDMQRQPMV